MNISKRPIVLVTGLSGMVGSRFLSLYGDKYELINLDLTRGIDITKAESVNRVFDETQAKIIIHLAAYTNVSMAHEQTNNKSGVCYTVNVLGSQTVAQAAMDHQAYMIHISTDYVFDGTKFGSYSEDDEPHPIEWYGQTKLWAETEVTNSQVKNVILRMAYPYQAKPSRPDFLAKIRENLQNDTLPPAFTDHTITPTFVDDVAQVFDYCIKHQPVGLYHMVGSTSATDFEIANLVKKTFKLSGEVKPGSLKDYLIKNPRPYQRTMRISNQKLENEFGIDMSNLEKGLKTIYKQL